MMLTNYILQFPKKTNWKFIYIRTSRTTTHITHSMDTKTKLITKVSFGNYFIE
jgi:hypothetical protein